MKRKNTKIVVLLTLVIFLISCYSIGYASDYSEEIQIDPKIYQEKHIPLENTDEIDYSDFYKDMKKIIKAAEKESQPHIDGSGDKKAKENEVGIKHFSLIPHSHHAYETGYTNWWHYYWPDTMWTENRYYPDHDDWPTVAWTGGESFTKSASWTTAVGVTEQVISSELGFNITVSSTVTCSTTRTYKIPYMQKGRIKITSQFKKYNYDLETKYYVDLSHTIYLYSEYGTGQADGPLYNSTCGIELVDL